VTLSFIVQTYLLNFAEGHNQFHLQVLTKNNSTSMSFQRNINNIYIYSIIIDLVS